MVVVVVVVVRARNQPSPVKMKSPSDMKMVSVKCFFSPVMMCHLRECAQAGNQPSPIVKAFSLISHGAKLKNFPGGNFFVSTCHDMSFMSVARSEREATTNHDCLSYSRPYLCASMHHPTQIVGD